LRRKTNAGITFTATAARRSSGTDKRASLDESNAGRSKSTPTMMKKIGIKNPKPMASSWLDSALSSVAHALMKAIMEPETLK